MNGHNKQLQQLKKVFGESYEACRKTNEAIVSELKKQGINASLCQKPSYL